MPNRPSFQRESFLYTPGSTETGHVGGAAANAPARPNVQQHHCKINCPLPEAGKLHAHHLAAASYSARPMAGGTARSLLGRRVDAARASLIPEVARVLRPPACAERPRPSPSQEQTMARAPRRRQGERGMWRRTRIPEETGQAHCRRRCQAVRQLGVASLVEVLRKTQRVLLDVLRKK